MSAPTNPADPALGPVAASESRGAAADLRAVGAFRPDPGGAGRVRRVLAQAGFDTRVLLSNGEQLLLTLILPALALVGLHLTTVPSLGAGRRIDVATPGVLALAVISTSFTGQAIGTAFDRRYGVLRLLATTPLGRGGLLAGRVLAVLTVQAIQVVVLGTLALWLGWEPDAAGAPAALLGVLLGTATFVALGLLLAGTLRAEAVLAGANLIWILLVAGGGVVLPPDRLGHASHFAELLPSGALGDVLRAALLHAHLAWGPLAVLAGWGLLAVAAAVRWFRWD